MTMNSKTKVEQSRSECIRVPQVGKTPKTRVEQLKKDAKETPKTRVEQLKEDAKETPKTRVEQLKKDAFGSSIRVPQVGKTPKTRVEQLKEDARTRVS